MKRIIVAAAVVLTLVSGCDNVHKDDKKERALHDAKIAAFVAQGPRVVASSSLSDGLMSTIEIPTGGLGLAQVMTCVLFVHHTGASSMSCPGEHRYVMPSELPQAEKTKADDKGLSYLREK